MAASLIPKFCNMQGVHEIHIGVREFECMGALPPHDHPHVFLDMGDDTHIICPYCATNFHYDTSLAADDTRPQGCCVKPEKSKSA